MTTVIIFRGLAGTELSGGPPPADGSYLESADLEFHGGLGCASWTTSLPLAKHFESVLDALVFWRAQSTTRPYRSDGRPNKPLTAYTVEIKEVE